jgi:hypothetical protein
MTDEEFMRHSFMAYLRDGITPFMQMIADEKVIRLDEKRDELRRRRARVREERV